jgi:predicted HD phosphohydrolase
MATNTTRWNLVVSKQTDQSLRQLLANEGRGKKGDISRFVEEAVKKHIFDTAARAAKEHNKDLDPEELDAMIDESLAWARARMR